MAPSLPSFLAIMSSSGSSTYSDHGELNNWLPNIEQKSSGGRIATSETNFPPIGTLLGQKRKSR